MEAARRAASAAAASKGPAGTERSLPAAPIEKPVFQLSAAAAARRDARRGVTRRSPAAAAAAA